MIKNSDLTPILDNLIYNTGQPIIQRSDGLFTFCRNIQPASSLGTNLFGEFYNGQYWDFSTGITILGTWNTTAYSYDYESGWHYFPK